MARPQVTGAEAMDDWIVSVQKAQPMKAEPHLRTVAGAVVIRAKQLSIKHDLNFPEVCAFLLESTRDQCIFNGVKSEMIVGSLPRNLNELGLAKIAYDPQALRKYKQGVN